MSRAKIARQSLSMHGRVKPQPASDWTGEIDLPSSVAKFYQEVGPVDITIETSGNPWFFPRLSDLWEFQAGYRWSSPNEPVEDWPQDWLVVAAEGGAAFILSISRGVILCGIHGPGLLEPDYVFPDLNTMAICLGRLGSIVAAAGVEFTDDQCLIRPRFRDQALDELQRWLDSATEPASVLRSLGW